MMRLRKIVRSFVLMTMSLVLLSALAYARPVFEKGDAIYRKGDFPGAWILGHAGLYWEWEDLDRDGEPNDPDDLKTHKTIESRKEEGGVVEKTFEDFYTGYIFWGVYTKLSLCATQRRVIVDTAENQKGCRYEFFWGYKSPDESFRCDGLVEYCYEEAGADIVGFDTWLTLTPMGQRNALSERESAEVVEAKIHEINIKGSTAPFKNGKYWVDEDATIVPYANDGPNGSGITLMELWLGEPDDTPDEMPGKRLMLDDTDYRIIHIYSYAWFINTVEEGGYDLYVKGYDQAGNVKVTKVPVVIYKRYFWKDDGTNTPASSATISGSASAPGGSASASWSNQTLFGFPLSPSDFDYYPIVFDVSLGGIITGSGSADGDFFWTASIYINGILVGGIGGYGSDGSGSGIFPFIIPYPECEIQIDIQKDIWEKGKADVLAIGKLEGCQGGGTMQITKVYINEISGWTKSKPDSVTESNPKHTIGGIRFNWIPPWQLGI